MTKEVTSKVTDSYKQLYVGYGEYTSCRMSEEDYIAISPRWKELRARRLKEDHYQCQECGTAINLRIHHINYPNAWGTEPINDLVTLCDNCHSKVHNKNKEDK